MSEPLPIREMVPRDLPEVMEIEVASFKNPWSQEGFLGALSRSDFASYVYVSGRKVLSYLILSFYGSEAHVMNLAVHPLHRRKGIASECLLFAERVARSRDADRIALEVEESNLPGQLLYRKAGYRGTRVLRNFYPETEEDGYRMVRKLRTSVHRVAP